MSEVKNYPHGKRGFAAMDPAKQREIASRGGKKARATGKAHEWTSEEAREAARKGGAAIIQKRGKAYMSELGRKGGLSRQARAREALT